MQFILREYTPDDNNYIYHSFLNSYRDFENNSDKQWSIRHCPTKLYTKGQSEIIDFLLKTATCLVAVYPEDPEEIIGYIIFQKIADTLVVHWQYVRYARRNQHIATEMLTDIQPSLLTNPKEAIICTHHSKSFMELKRKANLIFDPFLITNLRLQTK